MSAVVTAALLVPGAAAAQASSPTSAQYDTQAQLLGQQAQQAPTASANDPVMNDPVISGLPFTGVDVALLGIVALALIGAGFALQRLSRPAGPNEPS